MKNSIRIAILAGFLCAATALIETTPLRVNTVAVVTLNRSVLGEYRVLLRCEGESSDREVLKRGLTQTNEPENLQVEIPARKPVHLSLLPPGGVGEVRIKGVKLVKIHRRSILDPETLLNELVPEKDVSDLHVVGEDLCFRITGAEPAIAFRDPGFASFNIIGRKYLYLAALLAAGLLYALLGLSFGGWWKYRELVWNITKMNLTIKYRGSFLGFMWSLLNPVLMIIIYSIAFRFIMRIQLDDYTLFLLVGLLPFNFFSISTASSTVSIVGNAALLKKVQFPREAFPISTTLFCFLQFLLALAALTPFILVWKTSFAWPNLLYIAPIVLLLLFGVGVALILSSLTVFYRDIQHFTEIGLMALFWVTPVIYYFELIPCDYRWVFMLNPCTVFINCLHDLLYWNRFPDALTWIGVIIWPLLSLNVGSLIFRRLSPKFAEVL